MAFTDLVKNITPEKALDFIRPFIPTAWTQWFAGYGTYIVGGAMIICGIVPVLGVPLPWVPPGTEGQWIAGGIAAFTVRRAIANKEKNIIDAVKENTEITKATAVAVDAARVPELTETK